MIVSIPFLLLLYNNRNSTVLIEIFLEKKISVSIFIINLNKAKYPSIDTTIELIEKNISI